MPELVEIARINGPHGLKGRLRVTPLGDTSESFQHYSHFYIGLTGTPVRLTSVEQRKGCSIIAIEGLDHISQVEHLRGETLYVSRDQLAALPDGEFYWRDLLGMEVFDMDGNAIGEVVNIFATGSNDVLEVGREKRCLIPLTRDVVREISMERGRIVIDAALMEGLLD
ncbi:MAG TPA: ribosome maturation factor RimM [Deltaproteobacteria bacterium]|nr:ribosome maturation factor RimM [Deltaproteobacteria bacterium]HPR53644.1 ribosome maturation factor RimM [Deltaproteobacteria bacterium]HXK47160.1 ribosome maturation factor RimM [Deltaproteobacteria bacterium]